MTLSKFLDPKNDVAFKRLFGSEDHKDILIHFINDILELKDNNQIEDVEFLLPIQNLEIASKKQSIVDVLCKDKNDVQIIVEMQVSPTRGFEKRAQYYAAKAYSRQLNSGAEEKYINLKEIIFIAIADHKLFPEKKAYKSNHIILDKKSYEHDLKDFSFTFIELPKFKKEKIEELKDITEKWIYFFKYAQKTSEGDLKRLIGSDIVIKTAYEALNRFNWNENELIQYDQSEKRLRDYIASMDYQYDKGIQKGIAQGREEGIEKGIQKGMQKGIENEKLQTAKNMLARGLDVDLISDVTGLPKSEIKKLESIR